MAIAVAPPRRIRAVIFDLDETLLDRAAAWRYSIEESVASVTGRRIDARPLVAEYRLRPWRHALSILVPDPADLAQCAELCERMFYRSALKRLLVHDGVGMALDHLRSARLDIGGISREPHANAIRQIESTGLDRFLTVLSATPAGAPWDVAARVQDCLSYVVRRPAECALVTQDAASARLAASMGFHCVAARWVTGCDAAGEGFQRPADLAALVA